MCCSTLDQDVLEVSSVGSSSWSHILRICGWVIEVLFFNHWLSLSSVVLLSYVS